jgi:glycosyltransferase involved in cell wall biosynthesis
VLVVTKFLPGGRPFGGILRTNRLVAALRERFDVQLVGFVEDGTPSIRPRWRAAARALATGTAYQVARYDTPAMRRMIRDAVSSFRPDALHVEYMQMAPACWDLDIPAALDLHNVESGLAASVAESSSGITRVLAARDAKLLARLEARASDRFGLITVCSPREAQRMGGRAHVVANGVDPSLEPLVDVAPDPGLVTFVGTMSWLPNIDGAEWFVREILPLLPEDLRLEIVGRTPDRRVQALAGPRVAVTGDVPDVWPYVARASVVVAPLLAPGGTRFKILEGLLAERPVVATPEAADGLEDLQDHGLSLRGDPASFAAEVAALAADPGRAAALGRAGRRAVIERYSWQASAQRLLDLYAEHLNLR